MMHIITRKELKNKVSREYKEGDCIRVGKYYIWIKYGQYDTPSLKTTVSTEDSFADIPLRKIPQYILDFIGCLNDYK
jgi:hypothetical protein